MKEKGRHPDKALSAVFVRNVKRPSRYADGNGLYLVVDASGAKRWLLRIVVHGRRRDIGLGGASVVSLSEAREEASELHRLVRKGDDPLAERRKARAVVPTFEAAARKVHGEHSAAWRNSKHTAQWIKTLEAYVFPVFGDRRVDHVDSSDVMKALLPIWLATPETARRVRQRIGTVLDWAKATGFRSGDNPVREIAKALPRQSERRAHFRALPYSDVPDFIENMRRVAATESARLAFEFLILTATRTSEVIRAEWSEIDFDQRSWTIPRERMKARVEHRVALSNRCVEILERAKEITDGSAYLFSGRSIGKPLSNMAFLMIIRRMQANATAHGFRSSFKDWATERTNFATEVSEMALAHTVRDKVEAAYRRGDLFQKRQKLMAAWSAYATSGRRVVPLRAEFRGR